MFSSHKYQYEESLLNNRETLLLVGMIRIRGSSFCLQSLLHRFAVRPFHGTPTNIPSVGPVVDGSHRSQSSKIYESSQGAAQVSVCWVQMDFWILQKTNLSGPPGYARQTAVDSRYITSSISISNNLTTTTNAPTHQNDHGSAPTLGPIVLQHRQKLTSLPDHSIVLYERLSDCSF